MQKKKKLLLLLWRLWSTLDSSSLSYDRINLIPWEKHASNSVMGTVYKETEVSKIGKTPPCYWSGSMEYKLSCCLSKAHIFTLLPLTVLQGIVPNNDTSLILTAHSISSEKGLTCLSTLDFWFFQVQYTQSLFCTEDLFPCHVLPFKEPLVWEIKSQGILNEDVTTIFSDNWVQTEHVPEGYIKRY